MKEDEDYEVEEVEVVDKAEVTGIKIDVALAEKEKPSVSQPEECVGQEERDLIGQKIDGFIDSSNTIGEDKDEEAVDVEDKIESSGGNEDQDEAMEQETSCKSETADDSGTTSDMHEDQENVVDAHPPEDDDDEETPPHSTKFGKTFQSFGKRILQKGNALKDNTNLSSRR